MFETIFKIELTNLKTEKVLIDKLWEEIVSNYTTPNRHYHNLAHLDNIINELSVIKSDINDWQTVVFSVAYHDIIYNILKQDNEEKSATLATERLVLLNMAENKIIKCSGQILHTKGHDTSGDSDTNYFTDADLAILGASDNAYKLYAQQIRNEYRFYPDLLYKPGRKKILQHFLVMDAIYKTPHFVAKYEQQARHNMECELKELER